MRLVFYVGRRNETNLETGNNDTWEELKASAANTSRITQPLQKHWSCKKEDRRKDVWHGSENTTTKNST